MSDAAPTTPSAQTPAAPPPAAPPAPAAAGATPPEAPASLLGAPPADTKPAEGEKPAEKAPAGDFEVKVPEGLNVDAKALEGFKALAKESGLDAPKAQKMFDAYVAQHQAGVAAAEAAWAKQQADWKAQLEGDADFGGKALAVNVDYARKAIGRFGGEALAKELDGLGLGNHPVLVKAFAAIGKAMADDSVAGSTPGAKPVNSEEALLRALYPSMYGKKE